MSKTSPDYDKHPEQGYLEQNQKIYRRGSYEVFPTFQMEAGSIEMGYDVLAKLIQVRVPDGLRVIMIDGYQGVDWQLFRNSLSEALEAIDVHPKWYALSECFASPAEVQKRMEPFLGGDDPLFGTHYPFGPELFFEAKKMADFRIRAAIARGQKAGALTIFYGIGAGLLELWDELWYLDFPKDLAQLEAKKNKPLNIAENLPLPFETYYKRSYFIEWPALNQLKQKLLPEIDLFIDAQDIRQPGSISGNDLRETLHRMAESPFRVRPWFFPGPWGGKFMQGHMNLDPTKPNFAWSFELIVPENGVIIEKEQRRLEFSFDILMFQESERVLGKNASQQFKYEWPLRFDYLDTVDGGNLSTQVHPRPDYIRKEFGETYTQDEAYYIIAAEPEARVYLGLTDQCDPVEFKADLEQSILEGREIEIEKYVNSEPSKPHDLFLIPNGTVHCSGAGNLVLEISATPYIFTFKIYDYLRRDLEGKLRPINIERGFANIRFERRKHWVQQNLLAKPESLRAGKDWQEFLLYDKPFTFYRIHRAEFESEFEISTADKALAINLVAGEQVAIVSENGRRTILHYIETMIIPAATGKVKFTNMGKIPCKIVLVYIKPGIGINIPLNDPQDG